jgi:hypothetical protein
MAWKGAASVVDASDATVVAAVVGDSEAAVVVVGKDDGDPQAATKHTTNPAAMVLVVTDLMAFPFNYQPVRVVLTRR